MRGTFIEAHISDIHFGAFDPKVQLQILNEQFIQKIQDLPLSLISINGDLFDRKFMANSEAITCASMFIATLVDICRYKNATLLIIHGTESHDAHQLNNFYHYMKDDSVDVRVIERAQFQYIKGKTILCLPEEYGKGRDYYMNLLASRDYDACYMHGNFVGGIYGKNKEDLDADREPTFSMESFWRCNGPIISGHVHIAQCLKSHFYYTGSPYRWCFGEEQPKGFMVLCHDLDTGYYYNHFEEITSFRYDTVDLDNLLLSDPKQVIEYLDNLNAQGVHYIKLKIRSINPTNVIIKDYYRNKKYVTVEDNTRQEEALEKSKDIINQYEELSFLNDPSIDEYTKYCMYVNHYEGENFVTVDRLKKILEES